MDIIWIYTFSKHESSCFLNMLHEVLVRMACFFFKKVLFLLIFSTLTCGASKFVYFSAEHVFVFNLGELVWFGEGVGVRS